MDLMLGQLLLLPARYAVGGLAQCNGQTLAISQYLPLFQAIGTTFGGDGQSTFALPNIASIATTQGVPVNWYVSLDGYWFASGTWAYLGQVMPLVVTPPADSSFLQQWLPCDGRILQINDYLPLFSLIGTQYGGDGNATFALPNLAPLSAPTVAPPGTASLPYYICTSGQFPLSGQDEGGNCSAVAPSPGGQVSADAYLGQIYQVPYLATVTTKLCGFGLCAGQMLNLEQNTGWESLLYVIGNQFGSTSGTTFALPAIPTGKDNVACVMFLQGEIPDPA